MKIQIDRAEEKKLYRKYVNRSIVLMWCLVNRSYRSDSPPNIQWDIIPYTKGVRVKFATYDMYFDFVVHDSWIDEVKDVMNLAGVIDKHGSFGQLNKNHLRKFKEFYGKPKKWNPAKQSLKLQAFQQINLETTYFRTIGPFYEAFERAFVDCAIAYISKFLENVKGKPSKSYSFQMNEVTRGIQVKFKKRGVKIEFFIPYYYLKQMKRLSKLLVSYTGKKRTKKKKK